MTIATVVGLFLIPVCYVFVQRLVGAREETETDRGSGGHGRRCRRERRSALMKAAFIRSSEFGVQSSSAAVIGLFCPWWSSPRWRVAPSARTTNARWWIPLELSAGQRRTPTLPAGTNSFADLGWWEAFKDPQLTSLRGRSADEQLGHQDCRRAACLQAEAAARITRSQFFPTVNAGGDLVTSRASEKGPRPDSIRTGSAARRTATSSSPCPLTRWTSGDASAAPTRPPAPSCWRRSRPNAPCARRWSHRSPRLICNCSSSISSSKSPSAPTAVRTNSLELTTSREQGGVAGLQDVYQAKFLVSTAEASIADIHRRIEQQENFVEYPARAQPRGYPTRQHP